MTGVAKPVVMAPAPAGSHPSPLILDARNLTKTRRDSERQFVVRLPLLQLQPGARLALLGDSGSGKSTLLSLLALATPPDQATGFHFDGHDIAAAWHKNDQPSLARLRAGGLAYLPQRDGLLNFLTLRQNMRCSAELAGTHPMRDMDQIVAELGLSDLLDAFPAALSGGQRQRGAAACALVRRPRALLADEPIAALDTDNARRVVDCLCILSARIGAALIFATHQPQFLAGRGFAALRAQIQSGPGGHVSTFSEAA